MFWQIIFTVETYHDTGIVTDPEEHETVQLRGDTKKFHRKVTGTLVEEKRAVGRKNWPLAGAAGAC